MTINGDDGADTIDNRGNKVTIGGGSGADSIYNEGANVTIDAGDGNDTVETKITIYKLETGENMTVSPDNNSISGGAGNDVLINGGGKNVTLAGGAGNDTLTGSANVDVYVYEGGKDVITNYSGEDTVKIASGAIDSVTIDDTDVVFKINTGSLTLKNMQGRAVTVTDADGNTTTKIYGETGYTAQEAIKNLVHAWNKTFYSDTEKLDEAIKLSTPFKGIQDAIDNMIADCKAAGDADTFLRKYCGIRGHRRDNRLGRGRRVD